MKDKINQEVHGNQNNVIGANGNINIRHSPVTVKKHYVYQCSDVEPQKVEDEIEYYLVNGWEFVSQYQIPTPVRRRGQLMTLIRLEFRKEMS